MSLDVLELHDFYRTAAGEMARRFIVARLRQFWPGLPGKVVAGLGYPLPYLEDIGGDAARMMALMPARQGCLRWSAGGRNRALLVDENRLPLPGQCIDRLLLAHALENAADPPAALAECRRVLAENGRMLVIAAARRGFWARGDATPFGAGRPYSLNQLSWLLRDNGFRLRRVRRALYAPPGDSRMLAHFSPLLEKLGSRWVPGWGGVIIAEAEKDRRAAAPLALRRSRPRILALPRPAFARTARP